MAQFVVVISVVAAAISLTILGNVERCLVKQWIVVMFFVVLGLTVMIGNQLSHHTT
ncbi:hypothetical protein ACFQPF_02660 [Fictibacillus iocasae]|uniref:Uncharacterized protein n=1 Tax=Fictibacillus iocasae TaxID=2715437 RepID=A0ABW2NMP7_9BACL